MSIGLIWMKCVECGCLVFFYNERLGETECNDCGLIVATEMFEETVSAYKYGNGGEMVHNHDPRNDRLGSIIQSKGFHRLNRFNSVLPRHISEGIHHCNMVWRTVAPQIDVRHRIEEIYMQLMNKSLFGKTTYEARATAVVYFVLLENGTEHSLKEVSQEFPDTLKSARKLVRKIKQQMGPRQLNYNPTFRINKTSKLITDDIVFQQHAEKALIFFESKIAQTDYTKNPAYYSAICWIAAKNMVHPSILKKDVAEKTNVNVKTIYVETKKLLHIIGYENINEIKGKKIW